VATEEVRVLKSIGDQTSTRPDLPNPYVAPRSAVEQRIAASGRRPSASSPSVSSTRSSSWAATPCSDQILVEINRALGVSIDPQRAFADFTIAALASLAEEQAVELLHRMTDEEAARRLDEA
jgi:hypothetical protein